MSDTNGLTEQTTFCMVLKKIHSDTMVDSGQCCGLYLQVYDISLFMALLPCEVIISVCICLLQKQQHNAVYSYWLHTRLVSV